MSKEEKPFVGAISAKERSELIRIIKGRFKLLRMQAGQRADEIIAHEQQRREIEAKERFREWYAQIDAINEEARPIIAKAEQLVRNLQENEINYSGRVFSTILQISLHLPRERYSHDIRLHVQAEIDAAELAVIEEILMGQIETEAAKELLSRIPTIEQLVSGEKVLRVIEQ